MHGVKFFEISSKCFIIASTILGVRVTLGADERADNGDDRDDRTNQFLWLKLLHTSYFSPSNQAAMGRVFYLVDNCFETGGDSRNFCDERILKMWTPCLSAFYCMISRATFA